MADEQAWEYSLSLSSTVSCVTNGRPTVRAAVDSARRSYVYSLTRPAAMQSGAGGRSGLQLAFREIVTFASLDIQPGAFWQREKSSYEYRLLDYGGRELLVYHWHPEAAGPVIPHIHVSASLDAQVDALTRREISLDKRHVVTGWVDLRDFVRMLITEFDIRPLRLDWQERLAPSLR